MVGQIKHFARGGITMWKKLGMKMPRRVKFPAWEGGGLEKGKKERQESFVGQDERGKGTQERPA